MEHLTNLKHLRIYDGFVAVSILPESIWSVHGLTRPWLDNCGNMTYMPEGTSDVPQLQLQQLVLICSFSLTKPPYSMGKLSSLKKLVITQRMLGLVLG